MIKFNIDKSEHITHGETDGVDVVLYKKPAADGIVSDNTIKYLEEMCSNILQ